MKVTVEAPALARALKNSAIFMPARNTVPYAYLSISPDEVLTAGSMDAIAFGTDRVQTMKYEGEWNTREALILPGTTKDPTGLTSLERVAREAGKLTATLEVSALSVTLTPMGLEPETVPNFAADPDNSGWLSQYGLLLEMLDEVGERDVNRALSRGYFSRFDNVKTDDKHHPLSIHSPDEYSPWFVKCGPTFRGIVAPVNEGVYSENFGEEGLW
ncbi:hypothetical protein ACQPZJ_35375 [Actinoplanes sp. CA-054009]